MMMPTVWRLVLFMLFGSVIGQPALASGKQHVFDCEFTLECAAETGCAAHSGNVAMSFGREDDVGIIGEAKYEVVLGEHAYSASLLTPYHPFVFGDADTCGIQTLVIVGNTKFVWHTRDCAQGDKQIRSLEGVSRFLACERIE